MYWFHSTSCLCVCVAALLLEKTVSAEEPQKHNSATVLNLPVVGETTFAWGVRHKQIVTGSNIGGFYVFADDKWSTLLQPDIKTSFQLYSSVAFHDRLLMGQYPTGRLFAYDGEMLSEQANWPPTPDGVSSRAREAQTTSVYGGELVVGVWPWGELWRMNPSQHKWTFARRMFAHPAPTPELIHPYDVENQRQRVFSNTTWGQGIYGPANAKLEPL